MSGPQHLIVSAQSPTAAPRCGHNEARTMDGPQSLGFAAAPAPASIPGATTEKPAP